MTEKTKEWVRERLDRVLPQVIKPGRYVGGEWNMIKKDWDKTDTRVVFVFPDVYEVGMSNLALRIIYGLVNSYEHFLCERAFSPWPDMEEKLKEEGIPLYALESFHPIKDFDIVAFTLQYELSYSNILNAMKLGDIPLRAADRKAGDPLVFAGGPCAYNPEPLAPFIDVFFLGESEEQFPKILEIIRQAKEKGAGKDQILALLAPVPGVYIPSFYEPQYNPDGTIHAISRREGTPDSVPDSVKKAVLKDFSTAYFPDKVIVPYTEAIHDRVMLEVMRGCTRGCRFCQAGMIYRPLRERSLEVLLQQARDAIKATGYEEISLVSLSTSDYSCVGDLLMKLMAEMEAKGVSVSLPSLRLDSFDVRIAEQVQKVRKSGLTFAPEAGTQRLRDVINKGVTQEDLLRTTEAAFRGGWSSIKLYYMIGLPTETYEDLDGIVDQARKVLELSRKAGRRGAKITVSASSFVPKPHTPFQWVGQDSMDVLREKQEYLRQRLRDHRIKFLYHDVETSFLEAVFARGDRKTADLLEWAVHAGCKFDGWSEHFHYARWKQGMEEIGLDPHFYVDRKYDLDEVLPWDHLSAGVSKAFLTEEYEKALAEVATPDCRGKCSQCGVCPDLAKKVMVNR
ncbi:TIGR03960 family B12-binding radical SAM protein [Dehalobacter sp. DCM]|uniref:TIGR03960 family B12-binding radical SAM protein n=1 Tax=Dehalobacter sp. DCM TaxID=2907827 RepID=UPI003081684F|nr:TIGR03960 family B12-binding radical SAM protein [Dehalobacter sp. DCM]